MRKAHQTGNRKFESTEFTEFIVRHTSKAPLKIFWTNCILPSPGEFLMVKTCAGGGGLSAPYLPTVSSTACFICVNSNAT